MAMLGEPVPQKRNVAAQRRFARRRKDNFLVDWMHGIVEPKTNLTRHGLKEEEKEIKIQQRITDITHLHAPVWHRGHLPHATFQRQRS